MNMEIKKNRCLNGGGRSTDNETRRFTGEKLRFNLEVDAGGSWDINLVEIGGGNSLTATLSHTIFERDCISRLVPGVRHQSRDARTTADETNVVNSSDQAMLDNVLDTSMFGKMDLLMFVLEKREGDTERGVDVDGEGTKRTSRSVTHVRN
jgi:hypothetical protein